MVYYLTDFSNFLLPFIALLLRLLPPLLDFPALPVLGGEGGGGGDGDSASPAAVGFDGVFL